MEKLPDIIGGSKIMEDKYYRLLNAIHEVYYHADADGNIIEISPSIETVAGYNPEEVVGRQATIFYKHPEDRDHLRDMMQANGFVADYDLELVHKDGHAIHVSANIHRLFDGKGKHLGVEGMLRDISERVNLKKQLQEAMHCAVRADKSKTEFLANMSHEIRTPMNAIIGLSYLAMDTELNKEQQDYLKKIMEASNALLAIINDILDFSKIEAGKLDMEIEDFDLEEALSNLSSVGGVQASKKGLNLLFDYPTGMPVLRGDVFRLGQVLLNLVNNAIKFTEKGDIGVAVEILEQNETDIQLRFSVTDHGIGMDEDQQSRLFQSFAQIDASTTRKYGGTGLGLAICKQLVGLMRGDIGVQSKPGEGSRFYFTARFSLSASQAEAHRHLIPNILNHLRVLIVDADAASGKILSNYSIRFGFDAVLVSSATEALSLIESASEQNPFQLLLMDWNIPDMDCIEVVRCIRNVVSSERIPAIILLAAYGFNDMCKQAEAAGVDGFLFKPVNASTLLDEVMSVLQSNVLASVEEGMKPLLLDVSGIRGAHLLLVEDNEVNQLVAQGLLARCDVSITIANNGQEALDALQVESFDGVLMDMQMPVMGGLEATRIIRQDARFSDLPILALTANAMVEDREMCLQAGMNDHIAKPINPDDLYAKITAWVKAAHPETVISVKAQHADDEFPSLEGVDHYSKRHIAETASGAETDLDADLIMQQMGELLEDYNADAIDLIQDLSEALSVSGSASSLSPLIQLLETKLAAYDFDEALEVLHQIENERSNSVSVS